jgi:hypothetical protein
MCYYLYEIDFQSVELGRITGDNLKCDFGYMSAKFRAVISYDEPKCNVVF